MLELLESQRNELIDKLLARPEDQPAYAERQAYIAGQLASIKATIDLFNFIK